MKQQPNPKNKQSNQKLSNVEQEQKKRKVEPVKQHWTQHRITLIAYQAQYMHKKKPRQSNENRKQKQRQKSKQKGSKQRERTQNKKESVQKQKQSAIQKRGQRKKVNLQYESGFLCIGQQQSEQIKISQLIQSYQHVNNLFQKHDQQSLYLQQFIKIMLQLKHSKIVHEFCEIYNIIIKQIEKIEFQQIYKQQKRFEIINNIKNKIINFIHHHNDKFNYFCNYFKDDYQLTDNLIKVEVYCILAEKFCFNINQFYAEAFTTVGEAMPAKRVKRG